MSEGEAMDAYSIILGFGFGGAGGAIVADMIGMSWMSTPLFFFGGIVGAALCSGAFGEVGDITDLFS